jgi:hypothetical protein
LLLHYKEYKVIMLCDKLSFILLLSLKSKKVQKGKCKTGTTESLYYIFKILFMYVFDTVLEIKYVNKNTFKNTYEYIGWFM